MYVIDCIFLKALIAACVNLLRGTENCYRDIIVLLSGMNSCLEAKR